MRARRKRLLAIARGARRVRAPMALAGAYAIIWEIFRSRFSVEGQHIILALFAIFEAISFILYYALLTDFRRAESGRLRHEITSRAPADCRYAPLIESFRHAERISLSRISTAEWFSRLHTAREWWFAATMMTCAPYHFEESQCVEFISISKMAYVFYEDDDACDIFDGDWCRHDKMMISRWLDAARRRRRTRAVIVDGQMARLRALPIVSRSLASAAGR